jgi:oxalate decarboxylase/phosphoglucose isomerase-like protein (cupin superfamily)
MKRRERLIAVSSEIGFLCLAATQAQISLKQTVSVHSIAEVAKKNPIDTASGRAITPVENGKFSSVTVWQFKTGIPAHFHRDHDEVIYCEQGEGIARLQRFLLAEASARSE